MWREKASFAYSWLLGDRSEDEECHSEPERSGGEESFDSVQDRSRRTGNWTRDSSACGLRMTGRQNQCGGLLRWVILCTLLTGCAAATVPVTVPSRPAAPPLAVRKTVVISDFEGGSVPPRAETQFWGKALASLLIDDLRASENLRIVDRHHLAEILREQSLSASALADPATRLRVGRIIGANYFIFGTYTIVGDSAMLVARMDDVETGQVIKSEQVGGKAGEMRPLSRKLSVAFLRGLDQRLAEQEASRIAEVGGPPSEAVRYFSEGLDYEHQGMYDKAVEMYAKALKLSPDYHEARVHLEKASEMGVRR